MLEPQLSGIYRLAIYLVALLESRVSTANELNLALHSQQQRPHPVFKQQLNYWLKRLKFTDSRTDLNTEHLSLLVSLAYPDRIAKNAAMATY